MRGAKPGVAQDGSVVEVPRAPRWMNEDAAREWRRVMPELVERRILTNADMGSVENFCVAMAMVRAMQRQMDVEGITIMTPKGLAAHPAVRIQSDAMTRARLLSDILGLNPVARSRPTMRDNSEDDADSPLNMQ